MKKVSIKILSIFTTMSLLYACNEKGRNSNNLVINNKDAISTITVIENDSMKSVITIKSGKVETLNKFLNEKLNGEQLKFYPKGGVAKKANVSVGISEGYVYEFYPSGSVLSYNYFCNIYPCYFGVEYWDNPLNTIKKSIHYGNKGNINKIRLFDTLGIFIKDSILF
jgi:hypothetical protein